ncbi:hypothetical protein EZS27_012468 [termite gut metagenome]|uniref:Uncharacterized protein n=1 Tax=termite gut metagenome TaxID=433724 RepID=A0A5J4S1H2_9ZZZZ
MKNSFLQYIILYAIVACFALALATLARMSAASMGFDSFTTFMVFIITLGIEVIVYLSIHVILQELMLPWIGRGLSKLPYIRNRIKVSILPIVDNNRIRAENSQSKVLEWDNAKAVAIQYTQTTFASFLADSEITRLCDYINLYAEKKEFRNVSPIKEVNQLTTTDIEHFGWNIWNHWRNFKVGKQDDIALFLKIVFAYTLREVEVESIKKHLKDDELKGIIKIKEDISE